MKKARICMLKLENCGCYTWANIRSDSMKRARYYTERMCTMLQMSPLFLHAAQLRGKRVAATPVRVRLELRAKLPASPISMLLSVTPIYVKKLNQFYSFFFFFTPCFVTSFVHSFLRERENNRFVYICRIYDVLCSMTDIKIEIVLLMAVNDITWKIAHAVHTHHLSCTIRLIL